MSTLLVDLFGVSRTKVYGGILRRGAATKPANGP
jgi:hypothetical protein